MAPDAETAEVSLIGPGYGESIVVHLGDGEWITVDSCQQPRDQSGVASRPLAYLHSLDVDPAQVTRVIATHWHDDHVAGIAELFEGCANAQFVCAAAFKEREFLKFLAAYSAPDPFAVARSASEIHAVLKTCSVRQSDPTLVLQDTLIRRTSRGVSVFALSPASVRLTEFLRTIGKHLPKAGAPKTRVRDFGHNAIAVALLIDYGAHSVLLGADLEETPGSGWTIIAAQSECVRGRISSVIKVPHHGSSTAECPAIWDELLGTDPIAILTPFVHGRVSLPNEADVNRILSRSSRAYSAARIASTAPVRRDSAIERTIREAGWILRSANPSLGHVRLRRRISDPVEDWSVELFGNATELKHVRQ